jgi:hypothetical protein
MIICKSFVLGGTSDPSNAGPARSFTSVEELLAAARSARLEPEGGVKIGEVDYDVVTGVCYPTHSISWPIIQLCSC